MVGFPPNRFNVNVKNFAKGSFMIGRKTLKDSQLPKQVVKSNGYILERPDTWMEHN